MHCDPIHTLLQPVLKLHHHGYRGSWSYLLDGIWGIRHSLRELNLIYLLSQGHLQILSILVWVIVKHTTGVQCSLAWWFKLWITCLLLGSARDLLVQVAVSRKGRQLIRSQVVIPSINEMSLIQFIRWQLLHVVLLKFLNVGVQMIIIQDPMKTLRLQLALLVTTEVAQITVVWSCIKALNHISLLEL